MNSTQTIIQSDYYTSGEPFSSVQVAELLDKKVSIAASIMYDMASKGLLSKVNGIGYRKPSPARYWLSQPWRHGTEKGVSAPTGPLEWRV